MVRLCVLALVLIGSVASAGVSIEWAGNEPSTATLDYCPEADLCLTITNRLQTQYDMTYHKEMTLDGVLVGLDITIGIGSPDTVTVGVPRGYTVEPQSYSLEEDETFVFKITYPLVG